MFINIWYIMSDPKSSGYTLPNPENSSSSILAWLAHPFPITVVAGSNGKTPQVY